MTSVKSPYKPSITKDEAIKLIYDHLYSDKGKSGANKLIRQRIRQAQKDGHFKTPFTRSIFNTKDFFEWAVTSKGWQSLNEISGTVSVLVSGLSLQGSVGQVNVTLTSEDKEQMEIMCKESQLNEQKQHRYILELEAENKLLKQQKDVVDKKKFALSNAMSIYGKKGGSGKTI